MKRFAALLLLLPAATFAADETYRTLRVVEPGHENTLWNIEGTLDVRAQIEPMLREGHVIDLIVDGARQHRNSRTPDLTANEIWRGSHTLQVAVFDSHGREVERSQEIRFFVHQTSVLNPNNPNRPPNRRN